MWRPYAHGTTVGQRGTEKGVIVRDEQHDGGARITLERDCRNIPFAVTCAIQGWFVHTLSTLAEHRALEGELQAL